jgi:hypothetical protein
VKTTQEAAERAHKTLINRRFKVVHMPSVVGRGAKMVEARIVAVVEPSSATTEDCVD